MIRRALPIILSIAVLTLSGRAAEEAGGEPPLLTFVQLSDAHMTGDGVRNEKLGRGNVGEFLAQAVAEINALHPDVVVFTGDLVEVGTVDEYRMFNKIMSALTVPWHAVPGNHETLQGTWADFEQQLGKPRYSSFVQNKCRFILLDGSRDEKKYFNEGYLDDKQMSWFKHELAAGEKELYTFVFCHWPLQAKWKGVGMAQPQRETILPDLRTHNVAAYIFGHRHAHDYEYADGTTHILCAGVGWNFSVPRGYRIYRVYPEKTVSIWKPLGNDITRFEMTIPNPRAMDLKAVAVRAPGKPRIVKTQEADLALHLKLDGEFGTVVPDYAGSAEVALNVRDWAGPHWIDSRTGKGLALNGMNDHLEVVHNEAIDVGAHAFTIAFWLKQSDPRDQSVGVLHKARVGVHKTPGYGFLLRETGAELKFTICDGETIIQTSGRRLGDTEWHHVAATRGGGKLRLYMDGARVTETEDTVASLSNDAPLVVGLAGYRNNVGGPGASQALFGAVDDVRIYRRALAEEEIAALRTAK